MKQVCVQWNTLFTLCDMTTCKWKLATLFPTSGVRHRRKILLELICKIYPIQCEILFQLRLSWSLIIFTMFCLIMNDTIWIEERSFLPNVANKTTVSSVRLEKFETCAQYRYHSLTYNIKIRMFHRMQGCLGG